MITTVELLDTLRERLSIIEHDHTEKHCLEPRHMPPRTGMFNQLSALLKAARAWKIDSGYEDQHDAVEGGDRLLLDALEALEYIRLPHDYGACDIQDCDECAAPDKDFRDQGDIVDVGNQHVLVNQRFAELQGLYKTRLDVTREALKRKDEELKQVRDLWDQVRSARISLDDERLDHLLQIPPEI